MLFQNLKSVIEETRELPKFRVIGVHGKYFANSGSSIVQELAFSLAQGAEYLTQLTELGLEYRQGCQKHQIQFWHWQQLFYGNCQTKGSPFIVGKNC